MVHSKSTNFQYSRWNCYLNLFYHWDYLTSTTIIGYNWGQIFIWGLMTIFDYFRLFNRKYLPSLMLENPAS